MAEELVLAESLVDPIAPDRPAGESMRWSREYDQVKEARRADDGLSKGKHEKAEPKSSDWGTVTRLCSALLSTRTKDLQLALWFTEGSTYLHGFRGLAEGLVLTRELMSRYWDLGLFPDIEDSSDDRKPPFDWLNDKLADAVFTVPITRAASGPDYHFLNLLDARRLGRESQCVDESGDVDPRKKRAFDAAVAGGRISLDLFDLAVKQSSREAYEELASEYHFAHEAFQSLERELALKFGEENTPNLSTFREGLNDLGKAVSEILERKRKEEPGIVVPTRSHGFEGEGGNSNSHRVALRLPIANSRGSGSASFNWETAEDMVRTGDVDAGLAEMTRLAGAETSGRSRFERKLLLAEICLSSKRDRLARAILEELAEQIDSHHLDTWESSEMISGVWTRLYEIYRSSGSDAEEAEKLYGRICRLDPWQALACST